MAFIKNKNLFSIGSIQFMNSSLEKTSENLSDDDFKYLIQKFGLKNLKLLKHKDTCPYEYMNRFKKFSEEKLPNKKCFYDSLKDQHISDKDYLTSNKTWNKFSMKNMCDCHDHYLKKDVL